MSEIRGIPDGEYHDEANALCNVLVNEIMNASTWSQIADVIWAIEIIRAKEKQLDCDAEEQKIR